MDKDKTPRTDKEVFQLEDGYGEAVMSEYARQLETELTLVSERLAAAERENQHLQDIFNQACLMEQGMLERAQRAEAALEAFQREQAVYLEGQEQANAQIKELRDALEAANRALEEARQLMGCHLGGQEKTGSYSSIDKPMRELCDRITALRSLAPAQVGTIGHVSHNMRVAAALPAPAQEQPGMASRDKALEFAEYMAKDAESFLAAANTLRALEAGEDVPELGDVEAADSAYTDHYRGLTDAIYEFRKRAKKVAAPAAQEQPVAWGLPNSAITGQKNALMQVELEVPSNDQYGGAMWIPLYAAPAAQEQKPNG